MSAQRRKNPDAEIADLRQRLAEAEATVAALVRGEVDAAVDSSAAVLLREAQHALRSSEAQLRAVFEGALDAILIADDEGRYVDANPAACALFGATRAELLGRTVADFAHNPGGFGETWARFLADGRAHGELEIRRADGGVRVAEFVAVAHFQPGRHLSVLRDATERRATEQALRRSEARFGTIFRSAPVGIAMKTARGGRVLDANDAFCEMLARPRNEVIGKSAADDLTMWAEPGQREALAGRLEAGEPVRNVAATLRRSDGGTRAVLVSMEMASLPDEAQPAVILMVNDVTEHRALEEQLRQAQKMEAVGLLAGGVAHDFNNLLNVILGHTELALRRAAPDDPVRRRLDEIRTAADRAAGLTRQLLAFSRKQPVSPEVVDLATLVKELSGMLRRLIGENIRLVTVAGPAPARVLADRGQLEQVIVNLVINARDAMPDGGQLVIEIDRTDPGEVAPAPGDPGQDWVRLAVSDTGSGIPEEIRERIFEPFFTTKPQGKGTGLGLSTVYGIVRHSGGAVGVESAAGAGTTFTVHLPATSAAEDAATARDELDPSGTETVLLVEDESTVREMVCDVLEEAGYRVVQATGGEDAITRLERGAIDLLLTDVVMRGMSGRSLAELARDRWPGLPVIFMSGYTDDTLLRQGIESRADAFIQKPFSPSTLTRKVRSVLDARS